jgi:hypothetical protein
MPQKQFGLIRTAYMSQRWQNSTIRIAANEQNSSSFPALASSEAYLWSPVVHELN